MTISASKVQDSIHQLKACQLETDSTLTNGELFPFACNVQEQLTEAFGERYTVVLSIDTKNNSPLNFGEIIEEIKVIDQKDLRGPTVVAQYNTKLGIDVYVSENGDKIYASGLGTSGLFLNNTAFNLMVIAPITPKHPDFNDALTLALLHQMKNAARQNPRCVANLAAQASLKNSFLNWNT
jgi:hypothetical protein